MHNVLPHLEPSTFPALYRQGIQTVQVNLGYRCNQSCLHCHVAAGPNRKEEMSGETIDLLIRYLDASTANTLDMTGGAPEMNPQFRRLVLAARERDWEVIDRCNLTILQESGYADLAEFLAFHSVHVIASLPCYLEENVDSQRGDGVFAASIAGLQQLNALGYGMDDSNLCLDLVYNPQGAILPPSQAILEPVYKRELYERYGVRFNRLLTLANMPIGRFGSMLISKKQFSGYLSLLRDSHADDNLDNVMCKTMISVDWQGYVYDCDFNQMLDLPLRLNGTTRHRHLSELMDVSLEGRPIVVRNHCYGCTAGQGSSCGGALS